MQVRPGYLKKLGGAKTCAYLPPLKRNSSESQSHILWLLWPVGGCEYIPLAEIFHFMNNGYGSELSDRIRA